MKRTGGRRCTRRMKALDVTCIILSITNSSIGKLENINRRFPLNTDFSVDATAESGKLGRLINHSRNGNLLTKTVLVDGLPRLALLAKTDIRAGQELLYDYGDRSKEALEHHPWLAL